MKRKNPLSKESTNLNITVTDDADFLSRYSEADKPVISGEVAEFVENVAKAYHPDQSFTFNIKSACILGLMICYEIAQKWAKMPLKMQK